VVRNETLPGTALLRSRTGTRARLVILGWPKGITPGVAEFTVFGKTIISK
jgi:hypothetical protein